MMAAVRHPATLFVIASSVVFPRDFAKAMPIRVQENGGGSSSKADMRDFRH